MGRTFEVHMEAGPPPSGWVVVRHGDTLDGTRSVMAETCADVAEALALVVTLAVDPTVSISQSGSPMGITTGVPPPVVQAPPPAAAANSPPSPAVPPEVPARVVNRAKPGSPTAIGRQPHSFWVGAELAIATGVTNAPDAGVSPILGWRGASANFVAPSIQLSLLHLTSEERPATGGAASFSWSVGRLDGCLFSWPRGPARILGCARVEGGVLAAAGASINSPRGTTRAWVATGPLMRGEWAFLSPLFIMADVAASVHLTHDGFYFLPNATIYEVPWLGVEGALGLGAHFL